MPNLLRALAVAGSLLLGGCAGDPGLSPEDWEALAKQRAQERWEALIAGRNESAYQYLSPAYREATPYTAYARKLKGFGMWKQAVVNEAKCDEDRCIVTTELHLEIRAPRLKGPVETVAYNQERWIKDYENQQLWFVPNK